MLRLSRVSRPKSPLQTQFSPAVKCYPISLHRPKLFLRFIGPLFHKPIFFSSEVKFHKSTTVKCSSIGCEIVPHSYQKVANGLVSKFGCRYVLDSAGLNLPNVSATDKPLDFFIIFFCPAKYEEK